MVKEMDGMNPMFPFIKINKWKQYTFERKKNHIAFISLCFSAAHASVSDYIGIDELKGN